MNILLISLEQSLVFLPLVFGMYLSYRILKITDLTVDGTYVLGGAVFARTLEYGVLLAMLFAVIAGIVVGKVVALMQRHNQVNDLIVGVLASFMLYSINLQILGRPNISLLDKPNLLTIFGISNWIIILVIIGISLLVVLVILLNSKFGLLLRAFGQDQKLLSILGKHAEKYRIFGLALSNMLASITGVLAAQINGFADINMGFGVALVGIGAIVIGGQLLIKPEEKFNSVKEIFSCYFGIFLYFLCISILLRLGVNPAYLKLVLGIILFLALRRIRIAL